jgi:predicted transcriptional regulator
VARRSPDISQLPLNALRAFEASARHLSFTRAGLELRVSQAAVSQQVKILEANLRVQLFRRRKAKRCCQRSPMRSAASTMRWSASRTVVCAKP